MCARLLKAGKKFIIVAESMFIGLFITRYNWKIATCYLMNGKKQYEQKKI